MMQSNKFLAILFIFVSHFSFSNQNEISEPPCNKPATVSITSPSGLTGTGSNKSITVCAGVMATLNGDYTPGSGTNNNPYQYSWYKKGTTPVYVNSAIVAAKTLTSADAGTWVLRVDDGSAGTSNCFAEDSVKFIVTSIPAAPIATNPPDFCEGSVPPNWTATASVGNILQWYTVATGGTGSSTKPAIPNTPAGVKDVWVSQKTSPATGGCESARTALMVNVISNPTIPSFTAPADFCEGSISPIWTATANVGNVLQWYTTVI